MNWARAIGFFFAIYAASLVAAFIVIVVCAMIAGNALGGPRLSMAMTMLFLGLIAIAIVSIIAFRHLMKTSSDPGLTLLITVLFAGLQILTLIGEAVVSLILLNR